ncbi:hypothetical protein B0H14DRAFT_3462267 [Mycena olivaceomarginata]|nr:hypothetical protein B0H14DRAFT_3462267 [Mycena olivaceomarginata]
MPFGAPPYETGVLLCTPVYAPDPGHEDQDTHTGGVLCGCARRVERSGDFPSLARALKRYPGARTFTAFTWSRFHDLWTLDCTEYHNHEPQTPATPKQQTPATPKKPMTPKKSGLTPAQRRRNEEHNAFLVAENARIETEEKARIERQEELAYLAATKPPLVPLSPQRARLQFERVLGLGAGAGAPPFHNVPDLPIVAPPPPAIPVLPGRPEDLAAMDGNSHLKRTRHRDVAATATLPPGYSDFELGPDAPRLFAVSGHSRVFRNRDRAVAVLQQTPGAELFWSCNPQEVWQFIAETHVGLE